jgi:hypothetical protein
VTPSILLAPPLLRDLQLILAGQVIPADRREALIAAVWQASRNSFTWERNGDVYFLNDSAQVRSTLMGMRAADAAFRAPWKASAAASDLARAGAKNADDVVRKALRKAATFMDPISTGIAAAMRSIRVLDGWVTYQPEGRQGMVTVV